MPRRDFRLSKFALPRVNTTARDIGGREYRELFTIENVLRVVIHSVLSVQISPNWWGTAVDPHIQNTVQRIRADYARQPGHTIPGAHDIYFLFLKDLTEIIRANSHLFQPAIANVSGLLLRLERVRLSRNVIGHMNWLRSNDTRRVDRLYRSIRRLARSLAALGINLQVP